MHAEHYVRLVPLEQPLLEHQFRTALFAFRRTLLRGLENKQNRSGQLVPERHKVARHPQLHRHVRVVTASVHHAHFLAPVLGGHGGGEGQTRGLSHRQCVHVGAYRHQRAFLRAPQVTDYARVRDACFDLEAHLPKRLGHDLRGAELAVAEFRILVKVPPPGDYLGLALGREPVDC